MKKPEYYISDDYAGIESPNVKFYYGYEVTDENGGNCFTATFLENGVKKVITIPYSKLGTDAEMWQCEECLLQGIAWIFAKYKLTL